MPTAKGSAVSPDGFKFNASFLIDEIEYLYSGVIDPNSRPFRGTDVILTYSNVDDLSHIHGPWICQVGINQFKFTSQNGVTITGDISDSN